MQDIKLYARIRESLKILRQCAMLYKDTSPEILATHPEYVSASKEQILTQNYSLMQHFVLITQGLKPPKGEVYVPTESPKGELGFLSIVMVQEDLIV
ncbi:NADH-ubiquinone oxidoreductase chain D [Campylobacter jejuni]|nr:NADH-ubiquinone oxidoreductase chain D [Campylobacter jejuni]